MAAASVYWPARRPACSRRGWGSRGESWPAQIPALPDFDQAFMVRRLSCNQPVFGEAKQLSPATRCVCAITGITLLAMLAVAAWLTPPVVGGTYGLHQQLGLPACRFVSQWQVRCPSCGMTTAWAHAVRGQLRLALADNVAGTLLALAAIAAVPWTLVTAGRGSWLLVRWRWSVAVCLVALVLLVSLVDWLLRLIWN